MFRFGYDFFDSKTSTMKRPNGARFNKQIIGETCQLYLPPWWGELLSNVGEEYEINSVKHYSQNKFQATEFIIDSGHGEGFCIGNILKYAQRYGKKGGKNRDDLLKVIHYGIISLYVNDHEVNLDDLEIEME